MFKGVNSPVVTIMKDDGSIDYANMRSVMLKNEH